MRSWVKVSGEYEEIEIFSLRDLLKKHVRYVCTDLAAHIEVYEDITTGELIGCEEWQK